MVDRLKNECRSAKKGKRDVTRHVLWKTQKEDLASGWEALLKEKKKKEHRNNHHPRWKRKLT